MKQPALKGRQVELKTDRFTLRTLTPADVSQRYVDWLNEPEINRYLHVQVPQTMDSVRAYVASRDHVSGFLFGILTADQRHVGNVSLLIETAHSVGNVGTLIGDRDYWGANVVLEARQAVIDFAFGELELFKLSGGCMSSNLPAVYNYQRQGWIPDGIRKAHNVDRNGTRVDLVYFRKLRSDWLAERGGEQD